MATAQTFDGILAVQTVVDSHASPDFASALSIDIIVIKGYSAPVRTSTISIPLPSGCVAFDSGNSGTGFIDDGSLVVTVRASSDPDSATAATHVNNMKAQLHKYKVTDDGQYELVWHSDETPFMGSPYASWPQFGGGLACTRDCSWGIWGASPIDLGTGRVTFAPIANYVDSVNSLTYLAFHTDYYYDDDGSNIANCLTRHPYPRTGAEQLYEAVTFDGTVVRSAKWDARALGLADASSTLVFGDLATFRAYQEPYLNVIAPYTSLADGSTYNRFATVDPDTYLPGNFGPLVYLADDFFSDARSRLPGNGFTWSSFTDKFAPLKRGTDGYYIASRGPQPVAGVPFGAFINGLAVKFTIDSARGPHFGPDYSLAWVDVDGNVTTWSAGVGTFSGEPTGGSFDFRPILPPESISGVISASRRLFTAV